MRQNWPYRENKNNKANSHSPSSGSSYIYILHVDRERKASRRVRFPSSSLERFLRVVFLLLLLAASRPDIVMNDRIDETAKAIKRDRAIAQTLTQTSLSGNRVPVCCVRNTMLLFCEGGFVRMMIKLELRKTTFSLPTVPSQKTHKNKRVSFFF
jgi:hypothetical protein